MIASTRSPKSCRIAGPAALVARDDDEGGVEERLHPSLEQERHLDDRELGRSVELLAPRHHPFADQGVQDGLQPAQLVGPLEDDLPHLCPVDSSAGTDLCAPALNQAVERRGLVEDLVRDRVGRERGGAKPPERGERLGLARGNRPRESDEDGT